MFDEPMAELHQMPISSRLRSRQGICPHCEYAEKVLKFYFKGDDFLLSPDVEDDFPFFRSLKEKFKIVCKTL